MVKKENMESSCIVCRPAAQYSKEREREREREREKERERKRERDYI